jgi:hypothetical protein
MIRTWLIVATLVGGGSGAFAAIHPTAIVKDNPKDPLSRFWTVVLEQ